MAGGNLIDQVFLKKLNDILADNFRNEEFGVKELAERIRMNRSQLHRKLHATKGVSASRYIREYRLQQAHKKLETEVTTVSEISYKVGFHSPTYFNTAFREYYGYCPGEVKFQGSITDSTNDDIDSNENKTSQPTIGLVKHTEQKPSKKLIYRFSLIAMILVIAFAYYIFSDSSNNIVLTKDKINNKSIAILPFKDMSSKSNTQWFCEGVAEEVRIKLSNVKDLRVTSRTSSERYAETKKSIKEITKELDVEYIMESSVRKDGNRVLISVKLFDANENHLWSENYNESIEGIFLIQNDVSKKIVKHLKLILSQEEEKALEKFPTENLAAYQLVLKGLSITDIYTQKNLEKSIELYEQALVLDPNYARAYAEIAQSYFILRNRGHYYKSSIDSAKIYVEKALSIDPNTFRAYAVRARINDYYAEWDQCKENFEKAIALNPNDAQVHAQYAIYFGAQNDLYNAAIQREIAQRLDPINIRYGNEFFKELIAMGEIEKAEKYFKKWSFIFSKEDQIKKKRLIKVFKNKDWTESVRFLQEEIKKDPNNAILNRYLGEAYDEILNDDSNYMKYARKAYKLDSTNSLNTRTYYMSLLENKKFIEAKRILHSKNFKSLFMENYQILYTWYYYYHQENYEKALEVLKDSLLVRNHFNMGLTYAQLGNRKKVDSFFSIERAFWPPSYKAFVYAVLKERDSMYYYLGKKDDLDRVRRPNSRREFDPYRKEERYKAFLRKNYLPITHWNE